MPNLLQDIPSDLPDEWLETLLQHRGLRVERIVSRGHTTPEGAWYCQNTDEWVLLVQGAAELEYRAPEDHARLNPGDWLFIPAGREHRVSWTAPGQNTVWLALHWPVSEGDSGPVTDPRQPPP